MGHQPGQSFPRPWTGYAYPRRKRHFTYLPASGPRTYHATLVDSFTVTQSLAIAIYGPMAYHVSVTDSFTVTQSANVPNIYEVTLTDSFTVSQTVSGRNSTNSQTLSDSFTVTDTANIPNIYSLTVTDSFTVTQNIYRVETIHVSLTQSFGVSQTVTARNATYHTTLVDSFATSQVITAHAPVTHASLTQTVTFTQAFNLSRTIDVVDSFTVTQVIAGHKEFQTHKITTKQTLTTAFTYNKIVERTLVDLLTLTNVQTQTAIFSPRTLTTAQHLSDAFNTVILVRAPHPIVSGVTFVRDDLVILESDYGAIVLPVPEFGDKVNNHDVVSIKRSMSGLLYAYGKSALTSILEYAWILDLKKAQELRVWVGENQTNQITLTNWKGEIWYVKIISEEIPFVNEARYGGDARQKVTATLQFEGNRLYG